MSPPRISGLTDTVLLPQRHFHEHLLLFVLCGVAQLPFKKRRNLQAQWWHQCLGWMRVKCFADLTTSCPHNRKNNKVNTFTQPSDYSILILLTLEFLMLSLLYTIILPPPRFGPSHASGRPRWISDSVVLKIPPHQHDSLHSLTTPGRRYESTCHTPGD